MPHIHIYKLFCYYFLLFEENEGLSKTQCVHTHETMLSACYRWATARKPGNSSRISVVEPWLSFRMIPVLSLQRFPHSPCSCICTVSSLRHPVKQGVHPSQRSIERKRNGCPVGLLQPSYAIYREPPPFGGAEHRNSQLAVWWVKSMF